MEKSLVVRLYFCGKTDCIPIFLYCYPCKGILLLRLGSICQLDSNRSTTLNHGCFWNSVYWQKGEVTFR